MWSLAHDPPQRIIYSLAATFLGRMCLSGGIEKLPDASWSLVREAIDLHQKAAPVIKYGTSRKFGETGASWRHPQGWQAVVRTSERQCLVVLHAFADAPGKVAGPLDDGWKLGGTFGGSATLGDGGLTLSVAADFSARVVLLER